MTQAQRDVITVLTDDHREVERVYGEIEGRHGDPQHRRELADHVIAELVRHSVAEEQYLCPTARRALPTATRWPTTRSPSTPRPSAP